MIIFIFFIFLIVLLDFKILKKANPKGRIIGTYAFLMAASLLLGILLTLGKRPVSPAEVIESIVRIMGGG
ncbi:MAG: hypothetical protein N3I35_19400 [Clostridia bacterium]|nr:hypothetical protein [Clostridia bacterium]